MVYNSVIFKDIKLAGMDRGGMKCLTNEIIMKS